MTFPVHLFEVCGEFYTKGVTLAVVLHSGQRGSRPKLSHSPPPWSRGVRVQAGLAHLQLATEALNRVHMFTI